MARHGVTDEQWDLIADLMPEPAATGRPRRDDRQMLDAILWILRTGAPWRDLPESDFGPWITAYARFRDWREAGVWDQLTERLLAHLSEQGAVDSELWCIDGSVIRASRAAAGASKGGRRKSRRTTRWGALEADSAPRSTSSATAQATRSR